MDGSREIMYIPCDEDCQPAMVDGKKGNANDAKRVAYAVAFSSYDRAMRACVARGWQGMVACGPQKWKSFTKQFRVLVDSEAILALKVGETKSTSTSQGWAARIQRDKLMSALLGLALCSIPWLYFRHIFLGSLTLFAFVLASLFSPILQLAVAFGSTIVASASGSEAMFGTIFTCGFAFTWVEVFGIFEPDVWCVSIDGISLRTLGPTRRDSPEHIAELEKAKAIAMRLEVQRKHGADGTKSMHLPTPMSTIRSRVQHTRQLAKEAAAGISTA